MGSTLGWFEVLVWDVSATHLGNEKWWMSKPNYDSVGFKGVRTCASTSFLDKKWAKLIRLIHAWIDKGLFYLHSLFGSHINRRTYVFYWRNKCIFKLFFPFSQAPLNVQCNQSNFEITNQNSNFFYLIFINLYIRKSKFFKPNCSFCGY